ncbi:MAG: cyclic nucleotide-binding domain-containing protein, partial [Blastocatellia bacterium]|nr:cyclic nucleotide-binding domain-containing protein [Blastocatellia bacterium]
MSKELKRQEIENHHAVLQAIKSIGAIEELVEFEPGHGYKYGVDLEVSVYGRNYGPGKKVGPYIKMFKYQPGAEIIKQGDWDTNTFFIVVEGSVDVYLQGKNEPVANLKHGTPFGEMAVIAGVQRAATIKASQEGATVLEVLRPAIRMLRKLKKFGAALDLTYRSNGRDTTLNSLTISDDLRKQLTELSEFKVLARGHTLVYEGKPMDRVIIIKDGWVKRASASSQGQEQSDYIGPGYCLGLSGVTERGSKWPYKGVILSRTEVLEIPYKKLMAYPAVVNALKTEFEQFANIGTPAQPVKPLDFSKEAKIAQERILDKGLADATNLLVMDMDLCVRCGNCSLACHEIHGQSRLTRRGIHFLRPKTLTATLNQSLLAPSVCLHCKDPECLTGCPTGAIARFAGGQVDINPTTCIGCGDCATQCPYNAISLIRRKDMRKPDSKPAAKTVSKDAKTPAKNGKAAPAPTGNGKGLLDVLKLKYDHKPNPVVEEEDLVAVKCNLCNNTPINPISKDGKPIYKEQRYNCVEQCPTGACIRVTPAEYFNEVGAIIGSGLKRDGSKVYGRKNLPVDRGKQLVHLLGIVSTLILCGATMFGIVKYGLGMPLLQTSWFNFRWITGIVGLLGIVVVMMYPVRRQMWLRRAGSLRHWMLCHAYAGVIAGVLLLLHGGTSLGGPLTASLMIMFDLVILTGLFGILIYWAGPRTLTKIEGEPLLIEDLRLRREELYQEIANLTATARVNAKNQNREPEFNKQFVNARNRVLDTVMSLPFL